jgi:hypothetical protein
MVIRTKILPNNVLAITLWPFILVNASKKIGADTIRHEKIHIRQQIELLVVFFYLWYGIEYLVRLIQYLDHDTAYKNISFEREAYVNENDEYFLKYNREPLNFINYLY